MITDTERRGMDELLRWPMNASHLRAGSAERPFYAGPFLRRIEDLDLGFDQMARPVLITRLLANCLQREGGGRFTESEIWQWNLKKRLQALMAVVVATRGRQLTIRESCIHRDCQEIMEMDVDLAAFESNWETEESVVRVEPDTLLQIRLPIGYDQLQWLGNTEIPLDDEQRFIRMATDLVVKIDGQEPVAGWTVPLEWIDTIGADLENSDSLTCLQISTNCPFCQKKSEIAIDLEDQLLVVLANLQKQLFGHIHRMASVYHWSEAEIIALSPSRHKYYLAQIEKESFE